MAILDFFAEHPDQAFNLTNVVKALRLNPGTCHSLLLALSEGGYLYRNPDKTFVLGPSALALGAAAQARFSPLDVARQEMRLLADQFELVVLALFLERYELVVHERAASPKHFGWAPPPGQRYPFHPLTSPLIAFYADTKLRTEINRHNAPGSERELAQLQKQVEFFRKHGFIVYLGRLHDVNVHREGIRGLLRQTPEPRSELEPDENYNVLLLSAPVYDRLGQVLFTLDIYGFDRDYLGSEILEIGQALGDACSRVTRFVTGRSRFRPV
jgi:DNA-binding IclR family transcriptional regulator